MLNKKTRFVLSTLVLFVKYKKNDQVKEDEMDRACSKNGGEKEHM
jgi:hypothetical protein